MIHKQIKFQLLANHLKLQRMHDISAEDQWVGEGCICILESLLPRHEWNHP